MSPHCEFTLIWSLTTSKAWASYVKSFRKVPNWILNICIPNSLPTAIYLQANIYSYNSRRWTQRTMMIGGLLSLLWRFFYLQSKKVLYFLSISKSHFMKISRHGCSKKQVNVSKWRNIRVGEVVQQEKAFVPHVWSTCGSQKRASDPLDLELLSDWVLGQGRGLEE